MFQPRPLSELSESTTEELRSELALVAESLIEAITQHAHDCTAQTRAWAQAFLNTDPSKPVSWRENMAKVAVADQEGYATISAANVESHIVRKETVELFLELRRDQ